MNHIIKRKIIKGMDKTLSYIDETDNEESSSESELVHISDD